MKELEIPFVPLSADSDFNNVELELRNLTLHCLGHLLWSNDGYKPKVGFFIAHNSDIIFLKFKVEEDQIRAVYNQTNDPVYKDSCVEFFISINGEANYYNLEFNCLGTCTIGYGNDRFNRKILPESVINTIRSRTKLKRIYKDFVYEWELTLLIPATVFVYHPGVIFSGHTCRVNFYKCGDDLPQPHFIAWNNIKSAEPNFHLPEYFCQALFLNK